MSEKSPYPELTEITVKQNEDKILKKIINYVQAGVLPEKWKLDLTDENERFFSRIKTNLKIHEITKNLMVNDKIVLPRAQVAHYFHICHDDSGHSGVDRVMHLMQHLVWPGKTDDILNYVSSCVTCLKRKGSYMQKNNIQMQNLDHGSKPFEVITIDYVHMKQSRTGKKYILTIMDNFSRWLYVVPCYRDRAQDAVAGLTQYILEYVCPKKICSDRGCHFLNSLFANFCDKFAIKHRISAAYRP